MKSLAVIPIAIGVVRAELLNMKQKRDEPFSELRTMKSHDVIPITTGVVSAELLSMKQKKLNLLEHFLLVFVEKQKPVIFNTDIGRENLAIE